MSVIAMESLFFLFIFSNVFLNLNDVFLKKGHHLNVIYSSAKTLGFTVIRQLL